jgi:hypothetical protein
MRRGVGAVTPCGVFQVGMLSEYSPEGTGENNKKTYGKTSDPRPGFEPGPSLIEVR